MSRVVSTFFFKLLWLLPFLAVSQNNTQKYVDQQLYEAKKHYRRLDYEKSIKILDQLYTYALREKSTSGAAMALIRKNYYQIENGDFLKKEPQWAILEQFKTGDKGWDRTLAANVLKLKGIYHNVKNERTKALSFLEEAIKLIEGSPNDAEMLGEIYFTYASIKIKSSQYIDANSFFLKSIKIFEKIKHDELMGQLYGGLAHVTFLMGEKGRAIDYAKKGISILKEQKDYENLGVQLSNLARIYQTSGDTENAIKYFSESAQYASKSARKETQFVRLVDLALVYHSKKDRANALKFMETAIAEGKKINQPGLHRYTRLAAMFAGYTGNEALMNKYYSESYAMALLAKDKDALRDWYGSLNFYYANVKKDSTRAYPYLEKFHAYKDSIINEKSKKDFNELEVQYQSEKKQSEINRLTAEKLIQELEIEKKNAMISANLAMEAERQHEIRLLNKVQEINKLKIGQQDERLRLNAIQIKSLEQQKKIGEQENQLKENKLQNEKLTRNLAIASFVALLFTAAFFVNRVMLKKKLEQKNMLLRERNRISSELHDEVGSTLTAINLLSHSVIKKLDVNAEKPTLLQVEKIRDNTQQVMENINDIVWSMNPENNTFGNIKIRMLEFAESVLDTKNIDYVFEAGDALNEIEMNAEERRDFYLIFKEALNNLSKYSQASQVLINMEKDRNFIKLTIKDNGVGFNQALVKKGNGLSNMKQRAERNNGSLEISSGEKGTSLRLQFPYAS